MTPLKIDLVGRTSGLTCSFGRDKLKRVLQLMLFLLPALNFLYLAPSAAAQSPDDLENLMAMANQDYETGHFAEAVATYEEIVEAGIQHSNVYYNLGNAYFKQGDLGRAILNYRRAQRLDPRDGDIAANLEIARARTTDRLEHPGQVGLSQIVGRWFTAEELSYLLLGAWLLICLLASLIIFLPRLRRQLSWFMAACALLFLLGLAALAIDYFDQETPEAVVIAEEVEVTAGPGSAEQYPVEFTLHAGAEIQVLERRLGWWLIGLPGNLRGWVPIDMVEMIAVDTGSLG